MLKMSRVLMCAGIVLLLLAGNAHAEKVKFCNGQLITDFEGANPCTTTSYGSNGEVGMVSVCASRPDSVVGKRALSTSQIHHAVGYPADGWHDDSTRTFIKFDVSLLQTCYHIVDAKMIFPAVGGHGRGGCASYCYVYCAPLTKQRPWNSTTTDGGAANLWVWAEPDTSPTWSHWKYMPGGGGDSIWTGYSDGTGGGADSARQASYGPGITPLTSADRWLDGQATTNAENSVDLEFNVTTALTMQQQDSLDLTNCGFVLWSPREGTSNHYVDLWDHWCTDATKRPYLVIDYIDTSYVDIPTYLGRSGVGFEPLPTHDVRLRSTVGSFCYFSDPHACSTMCGGLGPENGWADYRSLIELCAAYSPDAVFVGGDYCLNPETDVAGNASDSMAAIEDTLAQLGIPIYHVLGNWEKDSGDTVLNTFAWAQAQKDVMPEFYGARYYDVVDLGFMRAIVLNNNTGFNDGAHHAAHSCLEDSLNSPHSNQWPWFEHTLDSAPAEQPIFVFAHKPFFGTSTTKCRKNLRNFDELTADGVTYNDRVDSLLFVSQRPNLYGWLFGHSHVRSHTAPTVFDLAADTLYARTVGADNVAKLSATDSAGVYMVGSRLWSNCYVSDTIIARRQVRRWASGSDGVPLYIIKVDVMGDWWKRHAIDIAGNVLDTLEVHRY